MPPRRERRRLVARLAAAGVFGGSTYDGLVALEAAAHDESLLTLDVRAARAYGRVGATAARLAAWVAGSPWGNAARAIARPSPPAPGPAWRTGDRGGGRGR